MNFTRYAQCHEATVYKIKVMGQDINEIGKIECGKYRVKTRFGYLTKRRASSKDKNEN